MNSELLLDKFAQKTEKLGGNMPSICGEILIQGSRAEIIFIPETPRTADEETVRTGVRDAITAACSSEQEGAHVAANAQLGHLAMTDVTPSDIDAINSLPGVMFRQTVV